MDKKWAIVTGLDGALLDAATHDGRAAKKALAELQSREIRVVPCSDRTRSETAALMAELDLSGPFIVEGGAAIHVEGARVVLGTPHPQVRSGFLALREWLGESLRGWSDMSLKEISHRTGLSAQAAERARVREFDEPFVIEPECPSLVKFLPEAARMVGLRVSRGARFWHLHGAGDRGTALEVLRERLPGVGWIGIGCGLVDLGLLRRVDLAAVVPGRGGTVEPELLAGLHRILVAPCPGPAGWADAVFALLPRLESTVGDRPGRIDP